MEFFILYIKKVTGYVALTIAQLLYMRIFSVYMVTEKLKITQRNSIKLCSPTAYMEI